MRLIRRGAEAELYRTEFLGLPAVFKERVVKRYRHPQLDRGLRTSRLRTEARLLQEARRIGLRVPLIYDLDPEENRLVLEDVQGPQFKEHFAKVPAKERLGLARELGRAVALLHRHDLVHGDLTTSNILVTPSGLCFLDLSMGEHSAELEAKGVDLHLLIEAFHSAHPGCDRELEAVLSAYRGAYRDGARVVAKAEEIARRGRYT